MPVYLIVLRYSPSAADQRKPVKYDSGNAELEIGDIVELDGRRWRLTAMLEAPADNEPEHPTFVADPA